jgi:hypothetical protein
MIKFHKQTKPSFQGTVHQGRNLKFVIFAEPKHNIFCSENLHTDEIQHCLHHDIFFRIFLDVQNQNFEASKSGLARAPNDYTPLRYI